MSAVLDSPPPAIPFHHVPAPSPPTEPFQCGMCDRAYKYKDSLTRHVKQAHSGIVFACRICGKSYKSGNALRRHCKLHSADCLLQCTECDLTFTERYRLVWHVAFVHRGEVVSCSVCHSRFHTVWGYKRHLKVTHGNTKVTDGSTENVTSKQECMVVERN